MMMTKPFTQHQKIVGYMITRRGQQEWFRAYDFMPPSMTLDYIYCVGYEATARFAELAKRNPKMFETQPDGKYKKRRIRWETISEWLPHISKDLRYMFHRANIHPAEAPAKNPTGYDDTRPGHIVEDKPEQKPEQKPDFSKYSKHRAVCKRTVLSGMDAVSPKNRMFDIAVAPLRVGEPTEVWVKMPDGRKPLKLEYKNMAEFRRDWKVV